ncbi:MAG: sulfite exporter TauE/SafE family protein [Betaproteobacteria bacterium]|nr:sulfite exporter TauE/SafE family protein [Betaproteobacteria bacterium]
MSLDNFFIWTSTAALLIGMSKGGLPTIGMLAVPVLSFVMSPVKAAVLLLPIYVVSDLVSVWLYRHHFSRENLKILIPASLIGVFIGWWTAAFTSDSLVTLVIGLIGIGFCLNLWLRRTNPPAQPADLKKGVFWGVVAGFTSFISHAGAPPFQIYVLPQHLPKAVFAGTATLFFCVVNLAKVLPYQQLNPYSLEDLQQAAWLIPTALLGTVIGAYLTKIIHDKWFFRWVQIALFGISIKLVHDGLLGLGLTALRPA